MSEKERLVELAERCEAKAKNARKTECSPEYQAYWRGYAEALDESAAALRSLSTPSMKDVDDD
jgi:hypothetical protein